MFCEGTTCPRPSQQSRPKLRNTQAFSACTAGGTLASNKGAFAPDFEIWTPDSPSTRPDTFPMEKEHLAASDLHWVSRVLCSALLAPLRAFNRR
jgi:hypothetical protein